MGTPKNPFLLLYQDFYDIILIRYKVYIEQHLRAGRNTQYVFLRTASKSWLEYITFDKVGEVNYS